MIRSIGNRTDRWTHQKAMSHMLYLLETLFSRVKKSPRQDTDLYYMSLITLVPAFTLQMAFSTVVYQLI